MYCAVDLPQPCALWDGGDGLARCFDRVRSTRREGGWGHGEGEVQMRKAVDAVAKARARQGKAKQGKPS